MPLLVAVAGLLSIGILTACCEWRVHGVRLSRAWVVAEILSVFVLGGIVVTVVLNSIAG